MEHMSVGTREVDLCGDAGGDLITSWFAAMNHYDATLVAVLARSVASLPPMHTSLIAGGGS
jgi:hypothetical protein